MCRPQTEFASGSRKFLSRHELLACICCVLSSFTSKKLDDNPPAADNTSMRSRPSPKSRNVSATVRQRIERGQERLWRIEDFPDLPFMAVAQALSRLTREGLLQRLSKGVYYRSRPTAFGASRPNPAAIQKLVSHRKKVYPSGITAANLLGFSTQSGAEAKSRQAR